ncbi:MAG: hypothetical protein M3Y80_02100 [Verrucomicrobiota bacterium]|nr:hypothetical protein [Verrucomicrobiota bacterium]
MLHLPVFPARSFDHRASTLKQLSACAIALSFLVSSAEAQLLSTGPGANSPLNSSAADPREGDSPAPPPAAEASPNPDAAPSESVTLTVSRERDGGMATAFPEDAPHIYVRWSGENFPEGAVVRVAWIAEDVGDLVPANFVVDERATNVTTPKFGARFTLSRPVDGWAPGRYRLELRVNDDLAQRLQVTIHERVDTE